MLEDFWHIERENAGENYNKLSRKRIAKFIVTLLVINPMVMTTGVIVLHLRTDWSIFSSVDKKLHMVLTVFYVFFVVTACALLYTHLLLHIYLNMHIKIQMEFLADYFLAIPGLTNESNNNSHWNNVEFYLINGIKQHAKLLKYVYAVVPQEDVRYRENDNMEIKL